MDRRKKHRPKADAARKAAKASKATPTKAKAKAARRIRPAVRTEDAGRVTWKPAWSGRDRHKK